MIPRLTNPSLQPPPEANLFFYSIPYDVMDSDWAMAIVLVGMLAVLAKALFSKSE